jgi:hypothetical protein
VTTHTDPRTAAMLKLASLEGRKQLDVPSVPVGEIPPDLEAHWIADDDTERRWLFEWRDSRGGNLKADPRPDAEARALHQLRLHRAVKARDKHDRRVEAEDVIRRASTCALCWQPVLRIQLISPDPLTYQPEAEHRFTAPGLNNVPACQPCQDTARLLLAQEAAAATVDGLTRGERVRDSIAALRSSSPRLAPSTATPRPASTRTSSWPVSSDRTPQPPAA